MKKLFCTVLALVFVLCMSASALAVSFGRAGSSEGGGCFRAFVSQHGKPEQERSVLQ